eukprot:TRINITY_DN21790_c0_g1_i3.p1 TRINITY_DN21790_c0_g1~~TRINITY_DN21790_c0_g1_i3.p1  ORF type:complete len:711 (+),score=98.12 TRINITY_DN21790_c0_g1_i3:310-2442(+)
MKVTQISFFFCWVLPCSGSSPSPVDSTTQMRHGHVQLATEAVHSGRSLRGQALTPHVPVVHPGHRPYHVTRLSRLDQAEPATAPKTSLLQKLQDSRFFSHMPSSSYLSISRSQAEGLREHHQSVLHRQSREGKAIGDSAVGVGDGGSAFLQLGDATVRSATTSIATAAGNGHLRQEVERQFFWKTEKPRHGSRAVTSLSSLSSQYVGPIGVGTKLVPLGCDTAAFPKKMLFHASAAQNETGSAEGVASFASTSASSSTCTVQEESQIWVVFDTGSTNIWIASDLCDNGPCVQKGRRRFDHGKSVTFRFPPDQVGLTVEFGTGTLEGPLGTDNLHIGPFTVYNQSFALMERQIGDVFTSVPLEGILGLAFPSMAFHGKQPFFDNVIQQRSLERNEFAFYLSRDNPSSNAVFWGGVDPTFFEGDIVYFPVVDPYYWSIELRSFSIGDRTLVGREEVHIASYLYDPFLFRNDEKITHGGPATMQMLSEVRAVEAEFVDDEASLSSIDPKAASVAEISAAAISFDAAAITARKFGAASSGTSAAAASATGGAREADGHAPAAKLMHAIVDTGTTYFSAESSVYEEIMRMLPRERCDKLTESSHPTIIFKLADTAGVARAYPLKNHEYMVSHDGIWCDPGFMRIDIPKTHGPGMLLGEVFLRHYYTIFDRDVDAGGQSNSGRVGLARSVQSTEATRRLHELTEQQPSFQEQREVF